MVITTNGLRVPFPHLLSDYINKLLAMKDNPNKRLDLNQFQTDDELNEAELQMIVSEQFKKMSIERYGIADDNASKELISDLPYHYKRRVLITYYIQDKGMTLGEVAIKLRTTVERVKNVYYKHIRKLRNK